MLRFRSQCTCHCHTVGGMHMMACCQPDPTPPQLVIPIGPPACGKSVLADAWHICRTYRRLGNNMPPLGSTLQDEIVSPDRYREILTGQRGAMDENATAFKIVNQIVYARIRHNLDIFVDATNLYASDPMAWAEVATDAGYDVVSVLFTTDEDTMLERNTSRAHEVPRAAMETMFERWRTLTIERVSEMPGRALTDEDFLTEITADQGEAHGS